MSSSDFSGTTTSGSTSYSQTSTTSFGNPRTKYKKYESSDHSGYDRIPIEVIENLYPSLVEFANDLRTPIAAGVRRAATQDRRGRKLYRAKAVAQLLDSGRYKEVHPSGATKRVGSGTGARPREALVRAISDVGTKICAGQRKKLARVLSDRFRNRRASDDTPIIFLPGPQPPAASQKTPAPAPAPNFGPPYMPGSVYARRR